MENPPTVPPPSQGLTPTQWTHAIYAMFALGLVTGIFFIFGVIVAYVKRDDLRGTYLESHMNWLIPTFWWGLLWVILATPLKFVGIGFVIWMLAWVWVAYRLIKGWIRLSEGRAVDGTRPAV